MANTVKTKTVNLGRLPVYCGAWGDRVSYHKYNIVTHYGSSFINLVEGNAKCPVQITFDASNRLVTGLNLISSKIQVVNGLDGCLLQIHTMHQYMLQKWEIMQNMKENEHKKW